MRPIVSASWTGLFLFAVGLYGGYYLPLTRYLTLAGTIPLDWFYFTLVVGGGLLAIASEEWTALQEIEHEGIVSTGRDKLWRALRVSVSLAALAVIGWWAIAR